MTTQERINQLTNAALRSAPPSATAPKPVTYMPSFDELKGVQYSSNPAAAPAAKAAPAAPIAVAAPVSSPAPAAAPAPAAPVLTVVKDVHESDPELKDMLDSRDGSRKKREKRNNRLATAALLLLVVSGGSWLTFSPTARAKMNTLVTAVKQSGKDVKSLGSIMGTYEKQLDKVAVQGARVDAAALALGVDPKGDASAQDASIAAGMKDLTGEGGGPTVQERDAKLQQKFGVVSKLAKGMAPKTQKAESDVQF
ncbi:hypothetical protein [Haloferula sp. BvORR071]|uniref:hypothetical protein n=1 Tax=Haloferula sp. BvORR071 TaxID=1396141 RepID=UPI00054F84CC|nr:hypothetical protein [Haloferula sp. BvORR071]